MIGRVIRPDFARVLAAEAVSNFGSMLSRLAIPWLATLDLGASAWQMATLLVVDVVAAALGGPWLAARVDRGSPRAIMLACDGLRTALFLLLALCAWQGWLTMPLLAVAAATGGLLTAGFELARSAWMARHLPVDQLPRCNAQLSAAGSLSETIAFASGGWLFQAVGAALALVVDAISYAVSAACLRGVPEARATSTPDGSVPAGRKGGDEGGDAWLDAWFDACAGLHWVARHRGLRVLAGIQLLLAAGAGLFGTCFMIFVARDIAINTGSLGLVFAVGGLGALVGAAAAPALGRWLGPGAAMAAGLALTTLGSASVPLVAGSGLAGLALLVLHQLVGDAGQVLHDVHDRTLRQTLVAHDQLARADAGVRLAGQVATVLAALVGGAIGSALGARQALWLAVALFAVAAGLAWACRSRFPRP